MIISNRKTASHPEGEHVMMRDAPNVDAMRECAQSYLLRVRVFGSHIRIGFFQAIKDAFMRPFSSFVNCRDHIMHQIVETRRTTADGLSIKRFKRLPPNPNKTAIKGKLKNTLPIAFLKALPEGQYCWTNRIKDYLGTQNHILVDKFFSNIIALVQANKFEYFPDLHDIIDPLRVPASVSARLQASGKDETLSILIHNYYIVNKERASWTSRITAPTNCHQAACEFIDRLHKLAQIYRLVYNDLGRIPFLKQLGLSPLQHLEGQEKNGLFSHRERLPYYECVVFLQFILDERDAFNQTFPVATIAGIIADLDALHKDEAPPSYVDWPGKYEERLPGAFPDDKVDELLFDHVPMRDFKPSRLYDHQHPSPSKFETYYDPLPHNALPKNDLFYDHKGIPYPRKGILKRRIASTRSKKTARFKNWPHHHWYTFSNNVPPTQRVYPHGVSAATKAMAIKHSQEAKEARLKELQSCEDYVFRHGRRTSAAGKPMGKKPRDLDDFFDEFDDPLGFKAVGMKSLQLSREKRDDFDIRKQLIAEAAYRTQREAEAEKKRKEEQCRRAEEERRLAELKQMQEEDDRLTSAGQLRQPHRSIVPLLADNYIGKAQATLRARPNAELARTPEGIPLTRKDFETVVTPNRWLNDEIVNGTLLHLANYVNQKAGIQNTRIQTPKVQVFNSFFGKKIYENGGEGTQRQMRRTGIRKETFLEIEAVLIPICRGSHWTLIVVRPSQRQVSHLDSLSGQGNMILMKHTLKWVMMVLEDRFDPAEWMLENILSTRQQNFDDCGVHTITNGMCLALKIDPASYDSRDMDRQRLQIASVLLNDGFAGDFTLDGV